VTKLLNAGKEQAEAYDLRLTKAQSQVQTLEKENAKIEAEIDPLRVAGLKELKVIAEASGKHLKVLAAGEIKEARVLGREVMTEFANYFAQADQLIEKVFQLGKKWKEMEKKLEKHGEAKDTFQAVAIEAQK